MKPEKRHEERLLTCSEAGKLLSLGERQVRELVWRNHIPSIKLGRHVRIPLAAIDELVKRSLSDAKNCADGSKEKRS